MYNKYCEEDLREFRYEYVEDGVKVVAYSGVKDNVRIPSSVDGTPVVELGINKDGYVGIPNKSGEQVKQPYTLKHWIATQERRTKIRVLA